jgi:hypothetical protein
MKVQREIASIPVRSAGETWQAILELVTGSGSVDVDTLKAASSVMESLIADEHPATVPIVVKGHGPQLVIYCLYNEAAMEAGKDIDSINWNPTAGSGWKMTALKWLDFRIPALVVVQDREIVQRLCDVGMLRTESFLTYGH